MRAKYVYSFILIASMISLIKIYPQSLDEGRNYLRNENYVQAKSVFLQLTRNAPGLADNYYFLGKVYFVTGNIDSAKIYFQKGLSLNSESALNLIGLGGIALSRNDTASASKYFSDAIDINSDDPLIYLNIADICLSLKNNSFSGVKYYLVQAVAAHKKYSAIYNKLGDIYLKVNDGTQAIINYTKAIDYDSANVEAYVGLGNVYKAVKDYSEAENEYKTALKINPSYSITYRELSDLYSIINQNDKAVEAYKQFLDGTDNSFDKRKILAFLLYDAKKYEECRDLLTVLVNENPGNNSLLHLLAYTYAQLKDEINGIPALEKYISIAGKNLITANDYEILSKLYLDNGQDSLSCLTLYKVLDIDPARSDIYNKVELINYKTRNWNGVINAINLKLKAAGNLNAQEYFDIGKAYYFNKEYDNAITAFQKLVELKPDFALVYRWSAASKSNLDPDSEKGLAKNDYEKFISLAESDSVKYKAELIEAYSYLGYYYYIKKDNEKSRANWEKVNSLDPANAQALEAIKKIK